MGKVTFNYCIQISQITESIDRSFHFITRLRLFICCLRNRFSINTEIREAGSEYRSPNLGIDPTLMSVCACVSPLSTVLELGLRSLLPAASGSELTERSVFLIRTHTLTHSRRSPHSDKQLDGERDRQRE